MDLLYRLKKKYGATVEDMLDYQARCEAELAQIEDAGDTLARLKIMTNCTLISIPLPPSPGSVRVRKSRLHRKPIFLTILRYRSAYRQLLP